MRQMELDHRRQEDLTTTRLTHLYWAIWANNCYEVIPVCDPFHEALTFILES